MATSIQSINPATGKPLETFEETTLQDLDRILRTAQSAFHEWRAVPFAARAQSMQKAAVLLRARKAEYARTMALEMGKPQAWLDLRDALHHRVHESIKRGAQRLLGGEMPAGEAAFYPRRPSVRWRR